MGDCIPQNEAFCKSVGAEQLDTGFSDALNYTSFSWGHVESSIPLGNLPLKVV